MTTTATIDIRTDRRSTIDPLIYGHFLESAFFGNIDGGVFDEGSSLAYDDPDARNGLRRDVVKLCRELGLPVVRWPGGNFTSPYHWEDGIGPRAERPRRLELAWGEEEDNHFGTDEFLAWCAEVGTEPYLAHSCRDVDDAVRWVEYTNYGGDTTYARKRAANGHPDPYKVKYWGLGNEVYGRWQMGHRSAEAYAADATEHARFMRAVDPSLKFIGVGLTDDRRGWTDTVLKAVGNQIDYLSFHLYGATTQLVDGDTEYDAIVAQAQYFEQQIQTYADLVAGLAAQHGIERPLGLALDEWNIRHVEPDTWPEPQASDDGGTIERDVDGLSTERCHRVNRWSPRALADALFYAGVFHALHRASAHDVPVTMANTVNLLNANGVIVARPGGAIRATTYHVWDLYQNHLGPVALTADVRSSGRLAAVRQGDARDAAGEFRTRSGTVPDLDVSATQTEDGRSLRLAVINRHRTATIRADLMLDGRAEGLPARVAVRDLGVDVDDVLASNSLSSPDNVALRDRGVLDLTNAGYDFPPHSITLLSFGLA
ncbi:alpha-N-arabinofuranosidase [Kribbella pittospori]|uniref:non-reducing end alpha-L-arabinofuranosidase n=1 Tax=Kribbella pittospori TaxID=722689 RepID=A0A4R0KS15_9ACTN|nr:alpha-L-arabinofuranosidase C-terminal domain-containing protein [Kribbella pittospori]TCC63279.1 alpha-N-arabinofuranosidase [Kribbella pittospori]